MSIKIYKIPGGFLAKMGSVSATGNTWMEALGALVATNLGGFGVRDISYANDAHTRGWLIERGLNESIALSD